MIDLQTTAQKRAFNLEKHYLGTLCARDHDAGGGQSWRHRGHGNCVECCREGARKWRKENSGRASASTQRRDQSRNNKERRKKWPFAIAIGPARRRAKLAGIPFSLTTDDVRRIWIAQNGLCFWTGRPIDFWQGDDRDPFRPSLDKLIPALGYVAGNVVWASNFANRGRGSCEAQRFADMMIEMGFDGPFRYDERLAAAYARRLAA